MHCPAEIATILLEILQLGILRGRSWGWAGNARACAIEMDHVHNLPDLINSYAPERLEYYWSVERPSFVKQSDPQQLGDFAALWQRLERHVPSSRRPVPAAS